MMRWQHFAFQRRRAGAEYSGYGFVEVGPDLGVTSGILDLALLTATELAD